MRPYYMTMCFLWLNYKNTSGISLILSKSSLFLIKITQWGQFSSKLLLQVELVPTEQLLIVLQLSSPLSAGLSSLWQKGFRIQWKFGFLMINSNKRYWYWSCQGWSYHQDQYFFWWNEAVMAIEATEATEAVEAVEVA